MTDVRPMNCPICGLSMTRCMELSDDRYGYPGHFGLWRCYACEHLQLDASLSDSELSDLYTKFYPRAELDVEAWRPHPMPRSFVVWFLGLRASAFRWVPRNVAVLDIGCGFGESLGYHRERGCDAQGVEADANILRVARRHSLKVRHGLFNPADYPAASFDYVTLDQVIEHVTDPLQILRGVFQVLRPGGALILATPNHRGWGARAFGRNWIHWHAPYHQQFFSRQSARSAASRTGFVVERFRTVTNSAWLSFQWSHLLTLPAPGEVSPFWKARGQRTLFQRLALRAVRVTDLLGLNALLTRLFDLTGVGDNMVLVLRKPAA